jgi:predicted PurR-regulated permease PerM
LNDERPTSPETSLRPTIPQLLPAHLIPKPAQQRLAISFAILAGVTLCVVVLFLLIVLPYLLALVAAAMAALVAFPMFDRIAGSLGGRRHVAASIVVLVIALMTLVPIGLGLTIGFVELQNGIRFVQTWAQEQAPTIQGWLRQLDDRFHISREDLQTRFAEIGRATLDWAVQRGPGILGGAVNMAVQFTMFIIAFYFFLVDGRSILSTWERLTPIEVDHDRVIRREFVGVCRGAIWGTVLAALAQGVAMTVGLAVIEFFAQAGLGRWLFLLGGLTSVVAVIPFLGASLIWVPTAAVLFFSGHTVAALVVAIYGFAFVSSIDNVIKILAIKDSGNLHPLLVVVSVFGGLNFVGVLGVFLGPAIAGVVFALLKVVRQELANMTADEASATRSPAESATSDSIVVAESKSTVS